MISLSKMLELTFLGYFFSGQKTTYISYALISNYDNINLNRLSIITPLVFEVPAYHFLGYAYEEILL